MSKFFTYEDRLEIEACLKQDMTFGAIAKKLAAAALSHLVLKAARLREENELTI